MKYTDLFNPIVKGNHGLTEEFIYRSILKGNTLIPYWGGNQDHHDPQGFVDEHTRTKYNELITIFDGEGVIVSLDGSAGSMTYKKGVRFALNHHAGFITTKSPNVVDLEFFAWAFRENLAEESVSEGSSTLSLETLYSMDFELPSIDVQERIMSRVRPLLNAKRQMAEYMARLAAVREKTVVGSYKEYQAHSVPVAEIMECMSGNSGLTSSEIYSNLQLAGERYHVLSGTTSQESEFGQVPRFHLNGKPIRVFENREGILIVRKGKAGASRFLAAGQYTLTDDAYILYLRDDCAYKVSLEWLAIQHQSLFYEYASSSDNGTWNMTGFFENAQIDIPKFEAQQEVASRYRKSMIVAFATLTSLMQEIERMLTKRVAIA